MFTLNGYLTPVPSRGRSTQDPARAKGIELCAQRFLEGEIDCGGARFTPTALLIAIKRKCIYYVNVCVRAFPYEVNAVQRKACHVRFSREGMRVRSSITISVDESAWVPPPIRALFRPLTARFLLRASLQSPEEHARCKTFCITSLLSAWRLPPPPPPPLFPFGNTHPSSIQLRTVGCSRWSESASVRRLDVGHTSIGIGGRAERSASRASSPKTTA